MFIQRYLVECTDQQTTAELSALFRNTDLIQRQKLLPGERSMDVDLPAARAAAMRERAEAQGFKVRIRLDSLPLV